MKWAKDAYWICHGCEQKVMLNDDEGKPALLYNPELSCPGEMLYLTPLCRGCAEKKA